MKIKQAAQYLGLTEKAIRLYESRGLISPVTVEHNGRTFREYDEACLRELMAVGILRRAGFSMEQISTMQKDADSISAIIREYDQRLCADIEHMYAVKTAIQACDGCADIYALADALRVALTDAEEQESARPIRFRVWDEDLTDDQKQAEYVRFWEKQDRRERAETALLAVPRRVGGFFGRIWRRIRGGVVSERGHLRGGVICAAIFLFVAIVLGGQLIAANRRAREVERACVNAVFSSVRELDYLLTNIEQSGEYTQDDAARACFIVTQLTDAIEVAEGICGEGINMTRRNDLASFVGGYLQVSVNGSYIEGILCDGECDAREARFLRRLHADAKKITAPVTDEDGFNMRYRARYEDIRESSRAFADKWCDITLDDGCPYRELIEN